MFGTSNDITAENKKINKELNSMKREIKKLKVAMKAQQETIEKLKSHVYERKLKGYRNTFLMAMMACVLCYVGCTDAEVSQYTSLGSSADITCYSGGQIIYQGVSTGKISTEKESDGWFFRERDSGKLLRISGTCIIRN